jgi:muconate cycloisomerase
MKINDLELYLVTIGQAESAAPIRSLLVRIATANGVEGWGEAEIAWRPDELPARREALLAVLVGRSIYDMEELQTIELLTPPVRSAIEMAIWDLLGRVLHQPLCNLLGGYYRHRVPVSIRLTTHRPTATAQIARELAEQGFYTQTVLSGGKPEEDLATLAAIREMVGHRVDLRFDGMGRYDFDTVRELASGMESYGLQFFLDPLSAPEFYPAASLGRQTSIPLALWRTIRSPADVLAAVRCNAASFLLIDLEQVGGITAARACIAVAAAAGVVPMLGGRPSVGIAAAAMLHLAAATAALSTSHEFASRRLRNTVLVDPPLIVDGMIAVPQSPGLGVTVDRVKIERYQAG